MDYLDMIRAESCQSMTLLFFIFSLLLVLRENEAEGKGGRPAISFPTTYSWVYIKEDYRTILVST